jgi:small-conductance mechanosensitive channel
MDKRQIDMRNLFTGIKFLHPLAIGLSLISVTSLTFGSQAGLSPTVDSVKKVQQGVPVKPYGQTVFTYYAGIGPFTPVDRAREMERRITMLAESPFYVSDSLKVIHRGDIVELAYGDVSFGLVTAGDSIAENKGVLKVANERIDRIKICIESYKETHSKEYLIRSIIYSGVSLILLILLILLVRRLFRFSERKIRSWKGTKKVFFRILNYELLDKNRQIQALLFLNKVLRIFTFLGFLFIGLTIMFYLLPWTKIYTLEFINILLAPVKNFLRSLWEYLPNLITIVVILIIAFYINRFFRFLKREIEREALNIPGFYPEYALPTYNILRVIVYIFTLIVIWPYIPGSDSKVFQGVSIFLGLVFSLTSTSLLSNIMAGFSLTYTRAFRLGDRVKIGDVVGDVIEKSMLVTKVRTIKNEEITIPNSKIMSTEVINYSKEAPKDGLIIYTSVTIGYDSPWRQIHELLISAALATDGLLKDPNPFVLQTSLDDFYISYQINAYTHEANKMAELYSSLHQNIQDKFNEAGMEIMSPHYKSIRDGNAIAIPEKYREKGYRPPSFKVDKP